MLPMVCGAFQYFAFQFNVTEDMVIVSLYKAEVLKMKQI